MERIIIGIVKIDHLREIIIVERIPRRPRYRVTRTSFDSPCVFDFASSFGSVIVSLFSASLLLLQAERSGEML